MDADHLLGNDMSFSVRRVLRNIVVISAALIGGFVLFVLLSGSKGFVVQSDSMAPRLRRGDVVFVHRVAFEKLAAGDVVSAHFPEGDGVFTHRIVEVDETARVVRTRGDNNKSDDPVSTDEAHLIGRMWFSLPYVGFLALSLQEGSYTPILICLGIAVALILTRMLLSYRKTKSRGV